MRKLLKKNQIIIYIIALMIMTAGYLNYTTYQTDYLETSIQMESSDDTELAGIGDAKLVNSEVVSEENNTDSSELQNVTENSTINNTSNDTINETVNGVASDNIDIENTVKDDNEVNEVVETNTTATDEYFAKSKLERDTMYSQMIETYEKVLNSSNSLETQKQAATQEITKINNTKNSIMICENLIGTKGFENNIIFVNGESISIIIGANEITQEQVAQIQNIISREMKAEIENIHISNK